MYEEYFVTDMSGPMGSSAGVGAGVDLKDSEEVKIYLL